MANASTVDGAKMGKEGEGNAKNHDTVDTIVRIIEIEEGLPEQSEFVDGLMIKKNLAHKVRRAGRRTRRECDIASRVLGSS